MPNQSLQTLIQQGLSALKAGSDVAAKATDDILDDATYPALKQALQQGNQRAQQWDERIGQARREAGDEGREENPILEAHYEVSKKIRHQAEDDYSRDLGIIASGQQALHYWIAAFGTLRTYAAQAGLSQTQHAMQACLDEAKQADEEHTQLAERIMRTE